MNDKNSTRINVETLNDELDKLKDNGVIDKYESKNNDSKLPYIVQKDNYEFSIDENGKVTDKTVDTGNDEEIITTGEVAQDLKTYIGQEVLGYECQSDGVDSWKVFYADENNVYLIASDYITYDKAPNGKNGTPIDKGYNH